ncbi:hypothetical protein BGW80DRAFT_1550181 [Lactifluus volemus]|nr:hypothetical protein BGW80DRAFT_1550181 [Lactifluus volemus]
MTALMPAFSPLDQSFGSSSAGSQAKSSLSNTSSFTRLPKRRLEAVDDNDTSSVSHKRRRISEHTIVLEKIMVEFGILVDQLRRDQILNRTSGQLARAPERLACDPERLARAHTQLEELRLLDLSPDALVAMHDLFNTDPAAVDIFLSIKGEDVRNKWVERQVKLLGYIL